MIYLHLPQAAPLAAFLAREKQRGFTYTQHGTSVTSEKVAGFDNDFQRVRIGQGDAAFQKAAEAIRQWKMFPPGWTVILPRNAPIEAGETIAMYARFMGFWWRNSCRIVYTINEPGRFGFAYGTLPGHIECGEELFMVEKDEAGQVWYTLRAFSKPRHWLVKLAYPIVRLLQARFRRDSAKAMKDSLSAQTAGYK